MTTLIEIPDFRFSGFYYPEILEDLIQFKRQNLTELSEEDPTEPLIQLLRAMALVGHTNNVLLDHVAREVFFATCRLRTSLASHLQLIGYKLAQPSPATSELLVKWAKVFTSAIELIPVQSEFSTEATPAVDAVQFENLTAFILTTATDVVGYVLDYESGGAVYTDHTVEARTPTGFFTPWGTYAAGNILYIGHPDVMFDKATINIQQALASGTLSAVWEYYDGEYDESSPDSVTNLGSELEYDLTTWLGSANRAGMIVRVRLASSGVSEDVVSYFSGGVNKCKTGFLGQSSPSTAALDYLVGSDWNELPDLVDGTSDLGTTGTNDVAFTLPKTLTRNWNKTTVDDKEAWWIRFRICEISAGSTLPQILEIKIDNGNQYSAFTIVQGDSASDNPLGSSTGLADQEFIFSQYPVIEGDNLRVYVDESGTWQEYVKVDNFISSSIYDRHFTVNFDDDGKCTIKFGDGTNNGKIPPAGTDNVRSEYRIMVGGDGNVGANTIVVNQSGVSYIDWHKNPKPATGYETREGDTEEDIERLKEEGPADLRTGGAITTPKDVYDEAVTFVSSDGSRPIQRAKAFEEAFGPKTIEALLVGSNGTALSSEVLAEFELLANGDTADDDPPGALVFNTELTANNYTPKVIDVTAVVVGGNKTAIETALTVKLNALAKDKDGINYLWEFGESVSVAMIIHIIMSTDPPPSNVQVSVPSVPVFLTDRELPVVGTLILTVF